MKKRLISSLLALLMIFTMLPNVVSAEESKSYTDDLVSLESKGNTLFEIQATDSSGKAFANGRMTVYSYLENKTVGDAFLDDSGKATFIYQPDMKLIENDIAEEGAVDVHYAIFVTNGEEVVVEGFTQTYYSPDFFVEKDSLLAEKASYLTDNLRTDNVQLLDVKTEKIEDDKQFEVVVNEVAKGVAPMDGGGTITILETRDLGNKATDFLVANSANGCTVDANIVKGSKVSLSGGSIITTAFTATDSVETGVRTTTASSGVKYKFYTYYQYVEEKVQWTDGVSTITYTQVRPTAWKSGIGYLTYAESKNAVSPSTLPSGSYTTYASGSYIRVTTNRTYSIGSAASFKGLISGLSYKVDMSYTVLSATTAQRNHGNTTYYEYGGSGSPITELYVTRY